MTLLAQLAEAVAAGTIEVVDLTAPLSHETPILQLPEPFNNTVEFSLREISRYDERGPAWYWNDIVTGEHVGTHFDAPVHWITGRDGEDVSQVAPRRLIGPAVVLDASDRAGQDPDHLLQVEDVREWEAKYGPLPDGGWLLYRTGWDARAADQAAFLNANETGPHTPGFSVECAKWLAEETPLQGIGVETVGTDAGTAHSFDPPFPCHSFMLGAGKYGLTQLRNLDRLPPRGAVLIAAPLPIVNGSGSPARVLALVERRGDAAARVGVRLVLAGWCTAGAWLECGLMSRHDARCLPRRRLSQRSARVGRGAAGVGLVRGWSRKCWNAGSTAGSPPVFRGRRPGLLSGLPGRVLGEGGRWECAGLACAPDPI